MTSEEKQKIKFLEKENERLKKKIETLEEKLRKAGKLPTIVKYTIDNYNDELEKEKEILNRFNVPIWSISELCKRLVKVLEGDRYQGPLMTKNKLNQYFDLILSFTLQEYRNLEFAPKIYSDAMLFEKYEQIVGVLKQAKPHVVSKDAQNKKAEKMQKEYEKQYRKYLENLEVLKQSKITEEEEDDEELDPSLFSDGE